MRYRPAQSMPQSPRASGSPPSALVRILNSPGPYAQLMFTPVVSNAVSASPVHATVSPSKWLPELHQYPAPAVSASAAGNAPEAKVLVAAADSKLFSCWAAGAQLHKATLVAKSLADAHMALGKLLDRPHVNS